MSSPFPRDALRAALRKSLPGIDPESAAGSRIPFTYVPPSHARAIEPDSVLVEGIRGAGKSFWWNALKDDAHRRFVVSAFPETRLRPGTEIGAGYGLASDSRFPAKDVITKLVAEHDPRHVWKAVVATNLGFGEVDTAATTWEARTQWVRGHAEDYEALLAQADRRLLQEGRNCIILFDALDRLAADWSTLRPIAKALFQVALDVRSCRAIRLKLFVRPDMIEDREIIGFPDASKLLGQKVSLTWRRADLYALVFQCTGNDPEHGAVFRDQCDREFGSHWTQDPGGEAWVLPKSLRADEDLQKCVFHALACPTMASGPSGHKRGFPFTWLPNHLADGREQVSPRSFCSALRAAAEHDQPDGWPFALHYRGLQVGVQKASQIRVDEVCEDLPWVRDAMTPLRQLVVPCPQEDVIGRWESEGTAKRLRGQNLDKLPPQHLDDGPRGLLQDLQFISLVDILGDGRVQMPDVYRIAFGLGRRGGVKPVR